MTKRAAVLGFPIHHSLSPRLHGYWLQHYGINGLYEAIETPPEALRSALQQLAATDGFQGCNLTVPLKERVLPLLDHIDPLAAAIGAANTLTRREDGTWKAENTDAPGLMAALERAGTPAVSGKRVLVQRRRICALNECKDFLVAVRDIADHR